MFLHLLDKGVCMCMCTMGVARRVCGRHKGVRQMAAWLVLVGGFCSLSLNFIHIATHTHPPENGRKERREMVMDDDGKMMGGADNEGESETEMNEKQKNEKQVMSKNHEKDEDDRDDDDDGGGGQDEYDDDNSDEMNDVNAEDDNDGDADINDVEEEEEEEEDHDKQTNEINNEAKNENNMNEQKIDIKLKENETNDLETEEETKIEDKQVKDEGEEEEEEEEEEESKQERNALAIELKQNQDKPLDKPKIEDKNAVESKNSSASEENEEEEEEEGENKEGKKDEGTLEVPWKSPLALSGNFAPNETLNGRPVVKVLLLAYQRSGSSFTGELLSSGGGAFYVFEPFYAWRKHFHHGADPAFEEDVTKLLGDMLDCSPKVINLWQKKYSMKYYRRKPEGVKDFCKDASLRLVKTIRTRASFMLPWLILRQDVKVIHLVRDPRGILNSVHHGGDVWSDRNRDAALQCSHIENDLSLEQLGPRRYLRVRYEDLVERPLEETTRLFSFMGVHLSPSVMAFLQQHTSVLQKRGKFRPRYMNTYRNTKFRHDHWRDELDNDRLEQIQDICLEVLRLFQYPVLQPPE